eukprot:1374290-Amorphochlora_amoeboformis.AAC.3
MTARTQSKVHPPDIPKGTVDVPDDEAESKSWFSPKLFWAYVGPVFGWGGALLGGALGAVGVYMAHRRKDKFISWSGQRNSHGKICTGGIIVCFFLPLILVDPGNLESDLQAGAYSG